MKQDKDYVYEMAFSNAAVTFKPKTSAERSRVFGSMKFTVQEVTVDRHVSWVRLGFAYCHLFTKNSSFGIGKKELPNFRTASSISIDIDNSQIEMYDYLGRLDNMLKPTFAYTSMSNGLPGLGYRYRLVYVLDKPITDADTYAILYDTIQTKLSVIEKVEDNCGAVANQLFLGNPFSTAEFEISYNIFTINDFITDEELQKQIIEKKINSCCNLKQEKIFDNERVSIEFADEDFKDALLSTRLSYEEILLKFNNRYKWFDATPLDYNDFGFAECPDNYVSICRIWESVKRADGKVIRKMIKPRNGQRRKSKLRFSCLLWRLIIPNISFEHLLYNLMYEVEHFYTDDDGELHNRYVLMEIARSVLQVGNDELKDSKGKKPKYRLRPYYCRQNDLNPKSYSNLVRGLLNRLRIAKNYDLSKSIEENLLMLNNGERKVGKSSLYNFCKEVSVDRHPNKVRKAKNRPRLTEDSDEQNKYCQSNEELMNKVWEKFENSISSIKPHPTQPHHSNCFEMEKMHSSNCPTHEETLNALFDFEHPLVVSLPILNNERL